MAGTFAWSNAHEEMHPHRSARRGQDCPRAAPGAQRLRGRRRGGDGRQVWTMTWLDEIVVFDRSPICTWALREFLGRQPHASLVEEVERIEREGVYDRRVFFIE